MADEKQNAVEAARTQAVIKAKEDARQYNERHIGQHLSIPSVQVDDFSFRLGFDAAIAYAAEKVAERENKMASDLIWLKAGATTYVELSQDLEKYIDKLPRSRQ